MSNWNDEDIGITYYYDDRNKKGFYYFTEEENLFNIELDYIIDKLMDNI